MPRHESGLTCVHMADLQPGLCPDCQADYEEDTEAYHEFGDHPAGIERWKELEADLANRHEADPSIPGVTDDELPF